MSTGEQAEPASADLKVLGDLMDTKFRTPGGFRFGLDGILGLIPGVGDFITSGVSLYIVLRAASMGYSLPVLLRMLLNVGFEQLVDVIPVFGSLFDFFWKANVRNLKLMERYQRDPGSTNRVSTILVVGLGIGVFLLFVTMAILSALLVVSLVEWVVQ